MSKLSKETASELQTSVSLLIYGLNKTERPSTLGVFKAARDALSRAILELDTDAVRCNTPHQEKEKLCQNKKQSQP